jgi:hypothetical protein
LREEKTPVENLVLMMIYAWNNDIQPAMNENANHWFGDEIKKEHTGLTKRSANASGEF